MERRDDPVGGKRLLRAALIFGGAMLGMGGFILWALLSAENGVANDWASFATFLAILVVIAAAVNFARVLWVYRCPQCRAWLARVPGQPGDPILYVCPMCKVEWDTGWKVSTSD